MKTKRKTIYTCQNCGAQRPRWEGKCSDCAAWNSYVEETFSDNSNNSNHGWAIGKSSKTNTHLTSSDSKAEVITLDQSIETMNFERKNTGLAELNRVLGGGLVQGSFILLGGAPGIGKSTLLLQMAGGLAKEKVDVLYVSGEESVSQTGSRAHRLGIKNQNIQICSENNLDLIINLAKNKRPKVLIIDSIQTVFHPQVEAAPGSVSQVRECAGHLMSLAKNENMTVILVGHITKEGTIAGPRVLEHMVDCVLSFEGDAGQYFRLLRAIKNRFGPTNELGVFKMVQLGLEEIENPSELFLEERGENRVGSAIFASMEGTRPLLCEIQALTLSSPMPMPRRTTLGIEPNRLHMISAVLDRHLDFKMAHQDIFINVVGGLKLNEPSSDLAVAAALISADQRSEIDAKSVFFGEIGLTGEVRAVTFADQRIKEANKLGFQHFVAPLACKKHLSELKLESTKKITYVKSIQDLQKLLGKPFFN